MPSRPSSSPTSCPPSAKGRSTKTCSRTRRRGSRTTCARRAIGTPTPRTERLAKGDRLEIDFTVKRGALYRVADIRFEGTGAVGASDLAPLMSLAKGQPFVQSRLDADTRAVLAAYRQRGYADASIRPAVEPVPGARTAGEAPVVVVMRIEEGPQTLVSAVEVAGNRSLTEAELTAGLATRVDGPLFEPDVQADRDRMLVRYLNLGYRLAKVDASVTVSADRSSARVRFAIQEGPKVYVDHVLVVGNNRVGEATIRRELLLKPGEPLGLQAIEDSQRRLAALGVFRRVTLSELQHEADDRRDILVTVEEAPATTARLGRRRGVPGGREHRGRPARVLRNRPPEPLGQEPLDQLLQPRQPPAPHVHRTGPDGATGGGDDDQCRVSRDWLVPRAEVCRHGGRPAGRHRVRTGKPHELQLPLRERQGEPLPALPRALEPARPVLDRAQRHLRRSDQPARSSPDLPPVRAGAHRFGLA